MEHGSLALQYLLLRHHQGQHLRRGRDRLQPDLQRDRHHQFRPRRVRDAGRHGGGHPGAYVPLPVAVAGAVLIVALVGCLLELSLFRRLQRHSVLHLIIITIGLSIVIQEAALHIWDEKVRSLPYFTGNEVSSVRFLGAAISPQVLWVLGTVALVVLGCTLPSIHPAGPGHAGLLLQSRCRHARRHQHPQHAHALLRPERRPGRAGGLRRSRP